MSIRLLTCILASALVAAAQQGPQGTPAPDDPTANPGRPTIATPATLTPVGYLQFESGFLGARHSPEFSSQSNLNEVVKFSVSRRIELLAAAEPFAYSRVGGQAGNGTGGVSLGVQGVVYQGEGSTPTIALSYFRGVYSGDAPDLDIGSASNSVLFLVSADVRGFHYDTNYFFNEVDETGIRRAQFGQTLSVSHALGKKFGATGEIWHFTQPFLRGNTVGNLWALNYNARDNLVFDGGFNRGLTSTSTRWEVFVGVTYLLPHKVRLQ
ncbi:MAG: hypothetical protein LAO03_17900 [Acidobacteriia bacterium]|nr:hypothetical protein [Terriglobia bacterium]